MSTWAKIPCDRFRTLIGQFPEKNSNQGLSNSNQGLSNFNQGLSNSNQGLSNSNQGSSNSYQGLSIRVNGVSAENYNVNLIDNGQGDIVVEDLSKILKTLENKGYIIR